MKVILASTTDSLAIVKPAPRTMKALTSGGFPELPGDAVTSDLEENEAKRIEVARAMPFDRAVENMVRAGRDEGFALRWNMALLSGGETDATALDLIRVKDAPPGDHVAADFTDLPTDRFFRNAWRWGGREVYVDMDAAREVFITQAYHTRLSGLKEMEPQIELTVLLRKPSRALEARMEALRKVDLFKLGDAIWKAESPEALRALWPAELSPEAPR